MAYRDQTKQREAKRKWAERQRRKLVEAKCEKARTALAELTKVIKRTSKVRVFPPCPIPLAMPKRAEVPGGYTGKLKPNFI